MPLMQLQRTSGDFGFTATDSGGNNLSIDIPVEKGGNGNGFRPMQLLLAGLGGCSALDVVSILKKQKQQIEAFAIDVDGEREKDKEPSLWVDVQIAFKLSGDIEPAKAYRAVELSMNKYCSVAATLNKSGATIQWRVEVNGV
ncbi:MAG: OsmC family protein, partial [Candidatus Kuenenia stuttgartiensis]|nr:OsmC family protein [Candidatus Kuenenia stuttgartiensis]